MKNFIERIKAPIFLEAVLAIETIQESYQIQLPERLQLKKKTCNHTANRK